MRKFTPPQIIVFSFLVIISIGSILLFLPVSTNANGSMNFVDAIFTATSATCVTGLIVKDTGSFFTPFGQIVILVLFQLGGLGIMTFSVLFAILLGKRLSISNNIVIQDTLIGSNKGSISKLLKNIVKVVLSIELLGAIFLFLRWNILNIENIWHNFYSAIFHSISAFCNAGFSLYKTSFIKYSSDVYINIIMMLLIITGGLGFIVLLNIPKLKLWKKNRRNIWATIDLQTKIVLITSIVLILVGTIFLLLLENNSLMKNFSIKQKFLTSTFQAVTARTAGFNTLLIANLKQASLFFLIILMFIGASPASTGSGIKITTFVILIATITAMFKNKDQVSVFSRTIPKEIVREVILIFVFSLSWVIGISFLLLVFQNLEFHSTSFIKILFETTSAFSNVGLSTGITSNLNTISKILITITMFVGRLGPLTLAWAVMLHRGKIFYKYPEEKIMVG